MIVLSGNNLPKRQHELNIRVNEVASKNVPFSEIKATTETTDVDRLFKIDVAAKYRHTDYVIDTLKSGDSLYISRVLKKCIWLFDNEFSYIINTDYLHHSVFPFMSIKMKKKLLTSISMHVRNEDRAADFYHYCKKTKLDHFASKFLTFTSESFKLKLIQTNFNEVPQGDPKTLKQFLGNSFILFEAYYLEYDVAKLPNKNIYEVYFECDVVKKNNIIIKDFSYLYTVSDVKYLNLLEKYVKIVNKKDLQLTGVGLNCLQLYNAKKFIDKSRAPQLLSLGLRISKDIVVKHKNRIEEHPHLYLRILNLGKLFRHSSINEVENYAALLMPNKLSEFWGKLHLLKQIVNVVPEDKRYAFAKKIFANKYDDEDFETSKKFYDNKFYSLMTAAEKEAWALQHIESGKDILGKDYIWYKFINFDKTFEEVKKNIFRTKDMYKRSDLLKVLVESAKNNLDLEKIFHYYCERHVNEGEHNKRAFLQHVVAHHDVFMFDDNCWAAFNKILYSIKVYEAEGDPEFKIIAILYYIVNDKAMPNALIQYMELCMAMKAIKIYIKKLDEKRISKVYDYVLKFYLGRIVHFQLGVTDDKIIRSVHFLLKLMTYLKKTKADIPDIIMNIVKHDRDSYYEYKGILEGPDTRLTESALIKCLKTDFNLVVEKLLEIKQIIDDTCARDYKMKRLLNKLRVYFTDDIAKECIEIFNDWLTEDTYHSGIVNMAVYGIFQLSDEDYKITFLNKYVPHSSKIKYAEKDTSVLNLQRAIFRFACYSRPPVPLSNISMYLKGDYVHFCLPMFNRYLINLPMPLCLKFVECLINSPAVSTQKHGLRLAFQCLSAENLKMVVMDAWKNRKNVSIRSIIYKGLFEKTINEPEKEQCDVLKMFTLDLNDTDHDDLFSLFRQHRKINQLPPDYLGEFVEALWKTINAFKDNEQNIGRKTDIIQLMDDNINFMKKETVQLIVSKHIKHMFDKTLTYKDGQKYDQYLKTFSLVTHYIEYFTSNELDLAESIAIAKFIVNETLKRWNKVQCNVYVFRKLFHDFIGRLNTFKSVPVAFSDNDDCLADTNTFVNAFPIYEATLEELEKTLPLHEIYLDAWILRIMIMIRRVIKESPIKFENDIYNDFDTQYENDIIAAGHETAAKLGREIGNMVKEGSRKHTVFPYFVDAVASLVSEGASYINSYLIGLKIPVPLNDLKLSIARGLLEINTKETNLLAFRLLPAKKKIMYKSVYDTLKKNPDLEIQCCMFKKFGDMGFISVLSQNI